MSQPTKLISSNTMDLTQFSADIDGHQRKTVGLKVKPVKRDDGDSGIALRDGKTQPFIVERAWNAPAGIYPEQWFIVSSSSREVLFESPVRMSQIWGLLSWTTLTDEITEPIELKAGKYLMVFALGGIQGGQLDIEAVAAPDVT
jgi:hypothetical protein